MEKGETLSRTRNAPSVITINNYLLDACVFKRDLSQLRSLDYQPRLICNVSELNLITSVFCSQHTNTKLS